MEALIPVINKLQDVFNSVDSKAIELPQIVVVGAQSAGKSSVLESIVGRDFLPRGTGIVTRCPLILQLNHLQDDPTADEWAEFLHTNKKFSDFTDVRREIENQTDKLSGTNKGICHTAISLKIYSPKVVNLTLVDLPGMTKVPVGDQPFDIEQQIKDLCFKYISNSNSLILAVSPANADMATSEALKMAREVDPDGLRTLAVFTKLDLMDAGTDAKDVLNGRVIPVKLGIIGLVNRSQADIIQNKSIEAQRHDEAAFLQKKYPEMANRNGTEYLTKMLNRLLVGHIQKCLPDLKERIRQLVTSHKEMMEQLGKPVEDKNQFFLEILQRFASAYCSTIDGSSSNLVTKKLFGGARISKIFHDTLGEALEDIDPLKGLTPEEIINAIRNANGLRPALIIPEVSFELLVKRQVNQFESPTLQCVEDVNEELQKIVQHCIEKEQRFPLLCSRIVDVTTSLIDQMVPETRDMVRNIIAFEQAYVNTKHPDFVDADHLFEILKKGESDEEEEMAVTNAERNTRNLSLSSKQQMLSKNKKGMEVAALMKSGGKPTSPKSSKDEEGRDLTVREQRDYDVTEKLMEAYFSIIRKSIHDSVIKSIMYSLVNKVKDKIHNELINKLFVKEDIDRFLEESPRITEQRNNVKAMLQALEKAWRIVTEIREFQIW